MTTSISTNDLKRRMHGAVEALKHDLAGLRTGRASTALLDPVQVEVYGTNMPLNQVATVSTPEARMLSVQVWDRSNVGPVEKAIRSAGLGLNPVTDGQMIRLPIPELTEERRRELAKLVGQYAEKARVAVRNVRRDGMDHLKQDERKHQISEDRSEEHTSELQSRQYLVCRLLLEKKKNNIPYSKKVAPYGTPNLVDLPHHENQIHNITHSVNH